MNIAQYKEIVDFLPNDSKVELLEAEIIKCSNGGVRNCSSCCFFNQEMICSLLSDNCKDYHYVIKEFK